MYKLLIKHILFSFQAETAHHLVFRMLKMVGKIPGLEDVKKGKVKPSSEV